jgi:hypothetical protein
MIKRYILVLGILISFVLNGCGGGGNSSLPSEPTSSQKATINSANSKKVALSGFKSTGILKDSDASDLYNRRVKRLNKNLRVVSKETKSIALRAIAYNDEYECDSGYADIDRISSDEADVTYHNCYIDGVKYNGNANVKVLNSSYVKITFEDFVAQDDTQKLEIEYAVFEIDSTNNTLKIKKAYITLNEGSKTTKFLNYNTTYIYDNFNDRGTLTFSGWVKTDCTNGYVYLKSTPEIAFIDDGASMQGGFEISSKGKKVTVEFDDDMVYITDSNGVVESISLDDLYDELDNICP